MKIIFNVKPNPGHYALVELECLGVLKCIIIQNVNELHQIAGSTCIVELHGNIRRGICIKCNCKVMFNEIPESIPSKCLKCNNMLRPDLV